MAATEMKVAIGTFFKKNLNKVSGTLDGSKIPFLPKTLAKLVYMGDGKDMETKITETDTNVDKLIKGEIGVSSNNSYDTFEAYKADLDAGKISAKTVCVIKDDLNAEVVEGNT